uniref:Si:dkeyp-51f12.2 n=1 Tax=Stegastes partitus TaxID=144197 RepID=A0A3B5AYA3_9TELE
MPSLHHGAIFMGAFLIVTGGSTAFLASYQSRLQAFSLCCVVLGVFLLILGLFWAMNSKSAVNYNHREYDQECPHYPYNDYTNYPALFSPPGGRFPESQSVFLPHGARGEDFDYPPMDSGGFSPTPHPPPWLGPPPPYEVAIKTTCSSTHLRRAYSDTHLATEPLFGQSREISFEV